MNKKQIKRWLSALRSGEWKQANGYLTAGDRHCCIHVAFKLECEDKTAETTTHAADVAHIPQRAADELVVWNDELRLTFPEIADEIEKKLADEPRWLSLR